MQAVILAAGRGTRMGGLTEETPKPLLRVLGKTLLEHKLQSLPREIDEVIIVVGYLGGKIKNQLNSEFEGREITYVTQNELLGTAHGLWQARHLLKDRFMVMMGDDIYCREDKEECLKYEQSILVKEVPFLKSGGKVVFDQSGHLKEIIEGSNHNEPNALVNTALYVLNPEIFNLNLVKIPGREEYGLPQTIVQAADKFPLKVVKSRFWIPVTIPEDLIEAETVLKTQNYSEKMQEQALGFRH